MVAATTVLLLLSLAVVPAESLVNRIVLLLLHVLNGVGGVIATVRAAGSLRLLLLLAVFATVFQVLLTSTATVIGLAVTTRLVFK